jgi:hypothetical protein
MNDDDVRQALIRAVPELKAPADRIGEVARRVNRRRARHGVAGSVAAAALILGAPLLFQLGRPGPALDVGGGWSAPTASPGSPGSRAPKAGSADGVGPGVCPTVLDLMKPSSTAVAAEGDDPLSLPLRGVTLCRYRHANFDLSKPTGDATRIGGPRSGDPAAFGPAVNTYLQQRIWRAPSAGASTSTSSSGCLMPSPSHDISVDIVFTVDANGEARQYRLVRTSCANPDAPKPARQLESAVDTRLGPPY